VVLGTFAGLVAFSLYRVTETILIIGMRTQLARKLRMVRRYDELVRKRILSLVQIGLLWLWSVGILRLLQIYPVVAGLLRRIFTTEARFGEVGVSLGDILAFSITVWLSFAISRIIRFVLDEDVFPRLTLPRGTPNAITTGIHYLVLLLGFFLAVAALGANLSKFSLLAGALGVGVGFGLQNVVNNFISGLILITERPIMPGDTVEIGSMIGDVKRIGMRSSTIRTWSGAEVIVPNGNLISNEVINWTLSDRQRRLDIPVGVAYGSPVKEVMEILAQVASQHEDVLDNPGPRTLFLGFGASSLDFELRCWTADFHRFRRVRSDIVVGIEAALNEAGITIPFPQQDLHVKTVEAAAGEALRGSSKPPKPQVPESADEFPDREPEDDRDSGGDR
jgi:small-conductance mechanosensitive channel